MRYALALLVLCGCAADAGPPRWRQDALTLCAEPGADSFALLHAAGAWDAHSPPIELVRPLPCDITVRWGVPEKGAAWTVPVIGSAGDIRFADVTLHEAIAFGDAAQDPDVLDLQSVLTHEIGHALGLEHVGGDDAVMRRSIEAGEVRRELTAADIEAAETLYR